MATVTEFQVDGIIRESHMEAIASGVDVDDAQAILRYQVGWLAAMVGLLMEGECYED